MKASDIMTTNVASVRADTPVSEVASLMIERQISGVPVVDAENQLIGIISEGDLVRRLESGTPRHRSWWLSLLTSTEDQAKDFVKTHGTHARDVMTRSVNTVSGDVSLADIAHVLEKERVKRVPVVEDGKLVGIVSRADLLRAMAACKTSPPTPPAGDREIRETLLKSLASEQWAASAVVNVIVTNGTVHLWGVVDTEEQRKGIIVAAEEIPGVVGVEDHLGHVLPT